MQRLQVLGEARKTRGSHAGWEIDREREAREEENTSTVRYEKTAQGRRRRQCSSEAPHIHCQAISVYYQLGGDGGKGMT